MSVSASDPPFSREKPHVADLRFYAELRDFLDDPDGRIRRSFDLKPSVKDLIESCGVPHTEVDLVLVNGEPVDFSCGVRDGDYISVYPVFEAFDIGSVTRVRSQPLRVPRFVLDVHLGTLARYLRLLGLDADYDPGRQDPELIRISVDEGRILLTRDVELLKHGRLTHGSFVRATDPKEQLREVVDRFHLTAELAPYTRCMSCNGELEPVAKADIEDRLPPVTRRHHERFWQCRTCTKVYWQGSHHNGLNDIINQAT